MHEYEHGYDPAELLDVDQDDEQAFHNLLQESKIFYSQPTMPQSLDRIKSTGEVLSDEGEPLVIKRGAEIITYDSQGRPEMIQSGGHVRKRTFKKGYIIEEENSLILESGAIVGEIRYMSYDSQNGHYAVQNIDVYPYEVAKDGSKRLKKKRSFDLRGYDPVRPLQQSKPSFTWREDK